MTLYAWVTSAFIPKGSPVDHTWVTSYDSRINKYSSIADVKKANEQYWYCWGSFHLKGRLTDPIVTGAPSSGAASCLVLPHDPKSRGTIHWYGIDGVCHQVSNQVLYVTSTPVGGKPLIVHKARGYKLSSALFGTYGRRKKEWDDVRLKCGVAPISIHNSEISLLIRRMSYILRFPANNSRVTLLEGQRRQLLAELDEIGFATRAPDEKTTQNRVNQMNGRINAFLQHAAEHSFDNDMDFAKMFGINRREEVYLIDPELFRFPESSDRPDRNSFLGW